MPPAIRVENLGKLYRLGEFERYRTFRETIARAVTRPATRLLHRLRRPQPAPADPTLRAPCSALPAPRSELPAPPDTIWALKDVSFEVQHGEVLGIIGPNGAGKSTLLKILSRITEPTCGYAEIRGRVGSLLEVGTGFHPELTGRENVYLNGSILGMSKAEIRRKFDDIVSFAGVEKFIDTPVKRYSSGMQVRLAFAVAAHLDPEILIIDEVLAVGDAEFQKRCLGKMDEVARSGRTILFVSHNMAAVEGLCTRALLFIAGKTVAAGRPHRVIEQYMRSIRHENKSGPPAYGCPYVVRAALIDSRNIQSVAFLMGDDVGFRISFAGLPQKSALSISIRICSDIGQRILTCNNIYQFPKPLVASGDAEVTCVVRDCRLMPGVYRVHAVVGINGSRHWTIPLPDVQILARDLYLTARMPSSASGVWAPRVDWQCDSRITGVEQSQY